MLKSLRMCLFLYLPISTRFKPLSKYRFLLFSEFPYILSQLIPSTSPLLMHHCSDQHCYRSIFFSLTANFSFSYIHPDSRMSVLLWQTADHACVWSVFLFFTQHVLEVPSRYFVVQPAVDGATSRQVPGSGCHRKQDERNMSKLVSRAPPWPLPSSCLESLP